MILQPRRLSYKTRQKKRSKPKYLQNTLVYGTVGARLQQPIQLTNKQIFRLNIFLKQSSRKSEKTKRSYWFNIFPHLPLTRKTKGSRMGKGVGKLKLWFTLVPSGKTLVEFKHLRRGRFIYFFNRMNSKIKGYLKPYFICTK